jgi:hypothetical protein
MTVHLPDGYDFKRQHIMLVFIEDDLRHPRDGTLRHVKLVRNQHPFDVYASLDDWVDAEAPGLWKARYGESPDPESLSGYWAETVGVEVIPYDGPTRLTAEEQTTIYKHVEGVRSDLTMAMLYVMIEGLGWRPGACNGGRPWPSRQAMLDFWHFYASPTNDDPMGSLTIALTLLAAGTDGECQVGWEEIEALAKDIHREAKGSAASAPKPLAGSDGKVGAVRK